jgi:hypothetical protein
MKGDYNALWNHPIVRTEESTMKEGIFRLIFSAVCFLVCLFSSLNVYSETTDEKAVIASFESLMNKMVEYGSLTVSEPYKTSDGYRRKKWNKSDKLSYDIKKTDSIISPYIAILKIPANSCITEPAVSPDQIIMDFKCKEFPGGSPIQKYQFAYHDGKWELKTSGSELPLLKAYNKQFGKLDIPDEWNADNFLDYIFNKNSIRKMQE